MEEKFPHHRIPKIRNGEAFLKVAEKHCPTYSKLMNEPADHPIWENRLYKVRQKIRKLGVELGPITSKCTKLQYLDHYRFWRSLND